VVPALLCLIAIAFAPRIRIKKATDAHKTIISVSGRLQSEHLGELRVQIKGNQSRIVLDLDDVTVVAVEVLRFFNACVEGGAELLHCSPYIREWIIREKDTER
jgi:hypothetical protein